MSDIEQRLREAMDGVTKGPWTHYCAPLRRGLSIINEVQSGGKTPVVSWSGFDDSSRSKIGHKRNAAYIALCSPDNIGALLDTIASLRSKLEEAEGARGSALVATPPAEQHPDEIAVDCFAAAMKAKLKWEREQRNRSGWQAMSAADLSRILYEHLPKGDPVDVANLSMMLHQNGQQIETPPAERVVDAHPVYDELVRSRSKELHQKLGRDAMLRQNDPVQTIYDFAWSIWHDGFGEGMNEAEIATKPVVKDDETVVEALVKHMVQRFLQWRLSDEVTR